MCVRFKSIMKEKKEWLLFAILVILVCVLLVVLWPAHDEKMPVQEKDVDLTEGEIRLLDLTFKEEIEHPPFSFSIDQAYEYQNYDLYMEFLNGNKVVDGMIITDITIPTGEPEKQYLSEYVFVDSDGDDFYELHIRSERYYYIIDCENDELFVWKSLHPETELLNNGDYLYTHIGGAPLHHDYKYFKTDQDGEDEWSIAYSWYDVNEDGKYDENDLYFTQGTETLSYEEWKEVQKEYLCVGTDKISWIMLTEKRN